MDFYDFRWDFYGKRFNFYGFRWISMILDRISMLSDETYMEKMGFLWGEKGLKYGIVKLTVD